MKAIAISEFKATCLALLDEVDHKHEEIIVTKHGKPIAKVIPFTTTKQEENPLKNTVVFEEDIISPIDEHWDVE